ncbi:methylmalonyl-CoA mutase small subunit [Saccharopolyspora sp. HNM0986]|uniref:methylmalonyl-CoA mutase family protein n=1 Tax=Saccharopolyspora galaxeae TaxID=2781241 RepID=UPI00190BEA0D|nr:methylmalonyl-CoA mutase family protein [Saccharopolyspora sp. HNM0986]MBK0869189.1 methylmalonyl-CoA mutase small subunit [Saccharopolyspora sp. HNM0986]
MAPSDRLSTPSSPRPGLRLGGEFPQPTYQEWQAQVEKILRRTGRIAEGEPAPDDPAALLNSTTYDEITVRPLYASAAGDSGLPGFAPYVRGSSPEGSAPEGWDVRQEHADPDAARTNQEVLADLNGGATSLTLRLGAGGIAVDDLADALHGVHLDMIGVVLDAGAQAPQAAAKLLEIAADQQVAPSALRGNLGADPLGVEARTGREAGPAEAVQLARQCAAELPGMRAITVDAQPYHEAGGSDGEELGASLAAGVTYLRWLTAPPPDGAGLDVGTACGLLEFRYAATADQFLSIAKLRAARRLWEQVARQSGAPASARAQRQHAVTSAAMLTRRDPWVNMLRSTIATFAAGVGGAQAITVRPFDAAIGLPDPFARRVARNTQALLLDESHLAQVIDPAGGSWYVETLTDELADAAWGWFREIEGAGGLPAALRSGMVADRLSATWQRRRTALAHRDDPITGVSEFPNLDERTLDREPVPAEPSGGLPKVRYAQDFEQLRDAADAQAERTGERPAVFLATLGPLATYNARSGFARNLFAAGGLATPEAGPTESTQEVLRAYAEQPSPVVCLCSADQIYAERATETARALQEAGAESVLLAGKPKDRPDDVDGFVHTGCDAVEVLRTAHRTLGVE